MEWIVAIIAIVAFYYLNNRIDKIRDVVNENKGMGLSRTYRFDLTQAIASNETFKRLTNIKSYIEDKPSDEWTKDETKRINEIYEADGGLSDKLYFNITYLAKEDAFFIKAGNSSYFGLRRSIGKNHLYYVDLIGSILKSEKRLRLEVVERRIRQNNMTLHLFTVGLREFGERILDKSKYVKLADFPYIKNYGSSVLEESDYKFFGFDIKESSPWPDRDEFGEVEISPMDSEVIYNHAETKIEITELD